MADLWYCAHDDNKIGPCSAWQLKELAASGRILPTDTIWKEGIEGGVLARSVKNLFSPFPASVPPAQVPSPSPPPATTLSSGGLTPAVRSEMSPPPPDARPTPL